MRQSVRLATAVLCTAILVLSSLQPVQPRTQSPQPPRSRRALAETIEVDPSAPSHPFPHYWEQMFGSGRAILSLRDSYRRDLRKVKQATGFGYVRFHAIFHDEVGVYDEDAQGQEQ